MTNYIKRLLILSTVFALLVTWYFESRNFYCVGNGNCITVWKTYSTCYIIPGKYYGLWKPTKNFIESSKTNSFTFYFTTGLPGVILYKTEGEANLNGLDKTSQHFIDYSQDPLRFNELLYPDDARHHSVVKDNVQSLDVLLEDNFAIDKGGNKR